MEMTNELTAASAFDPERAKIATLNALNLAGVTLALNADRLLSIMVQEMGAPDEAHAKTGIAFAYRLLEVLAHEVEISPIEEVHDAETESNATNQKAH
jgi:hypothetical protein